jgi:hypothetical protein
MKYVNKNKKIKNVSMWAILLLIGIVISVIMVSSFYFKKVDLDSNKIFCSEKSRATNVCSEIYIPVCGYPQEKVYSNSCFACINNQIEYYVEGEC